MSSVDTNIWAVSGGKGRVGKSVVSSLLADALALNGFNTLLVDADQANPGIHRLFGRERPERPLSDFLDGGAEDLRGVLCPTGREGLALLCGADGFLDIANREGGHGERLLHGISGLGLEFVVVDMGGGTGVRQLDFFNMADAGIIVTNTTQPSIQSAYGFLKLAVTRKLIVSFPDSPHVLDDIKLLLVGDEKVRSINQLVDRIGESDREAAGRIVETIWDNRYRLVVNTANRDEADRVARSITDAAQEFLSVPLSGMGNVELNDRVEKSIALGAPIGLTPGDEFAEGMDKAVQSLISSTRLHRKQRASASGRAEGAAEARGPAVARAGEVPISERLDAKARSDMQTGLNNDVEYGGMVLHVQTEDLGPEKGKIVTHVFYDGRILFSRATGYGEIDGKGGLNEAIRERVRWQQRVVMAGISNGKLKDRLGL